MGNVRWTPLVGQDWGDVKRESRRLSKVYQYKEQVAYMVDMAKAEALDLLGEPRQAFELGDRYV